MTEILVVSNDGVGLARTLRVINQAGYRASGASTFEEAKQWLSDRAPDLVIADERLGAFNGLHVLLRARVEHPGVRVIVTTPTGNRALAADARSLDINYVVTPQDPAEWLAPITRTLGVDPVGEPPAEHGAAIHQVH